MKEQRTTAYATVELARTISSVSPRGTAAALTLSVAGAAAEGFGLLLLVPILGILTVDGPGRWVHAMAADLGIASKSRLVALMIGGFVGAMVTRSVLLYARDVAVQAMQARFVDAQRLRVMRALTVAPWPRLAALDHSRITSLVGIDIARIGVAVGQLLLVAVSLITLAVQVILAFALAPGLAAGIFLAMALGGALVLRQARARSRGHETMASVQDMMAVATGFFGGLKIAAAQRMRDRFFGEFIRVQDRARDSALAFQRMQARARLLFGLASVGGLSAIVLAGLVVADIQPARLIVVVLILARMAGPAQIVQQALQGVAYGLPAIEAVADMERRLADVPEPTVAREAAPTSGGAIVLDAVSYRHPGGGGLRSATLSIPAGSIVGVTGPSGGGKTTLIDLIAGLLTPQTGTIRGGGHPDGRAPRMTIAYVPQDGFLFHDTVRRNLDWGDPRIGEAAMQDAIATAGAQSIVDQLPNGLDSVIGERGALLSGGERQRLAIARALLCRPDLLILDEATNAMDEVGERALLRRLAALNPRPTILIVAHRESSVADCDGLLCVRDGVLATLVWPDCSSA